MNKMLNGIFDLKIDSWNKDGFSLASLKRLK